MEGAYEELEDDAEMAKVEEIVAGWMSAAPTRSRTMEEEVRRATEAGASSGVQARMRATAHLPPWSSVHPERVVDPDLGIEVDKFELPRIVQESWLREEMLLNNHTFTYYDGYLACGLFLPGDMASRAKPQLGADVLSAVAADDIAGTHVVLGKRTIMKVIESVPWLSQAMRIHRRSHNYVLIVDGDENALLMRSVPRGEMQSRTGKKINGPYDALGDQYLMPAAAICPRLGVTFLCELSPDPDQLARVSYIYNFRNAGPTDATLPARDGEFLLLSYYSFEMELKESTKGRNGMGGLVRLPTHYGTYDFFVTFAVRMSNDATYADADFITYYDGSVRGHSDPNARALCTPHRVWEDKRTTYEMGMLAAYDTDAQSWKHTLYDFHVYPQRSRDEDYGISDVVNVYALTGQWDDEVGAVLLRADRTVCEISLMTGELSRLDGPRKITGMDFLRNTKQQLEHSLEMDVLAFTEPPEVGLGKALMDGFKVGLYRPHRTLDALLNPYEMLQARRYPILQVRWFYRYAYIHEVLENKVRLDGSRLLDSMVPAHRDTADTLAKYCELNILERIADLEDEGDADAAAKLYAQAGKQKKKKCDPRVKAMLGVWDYANTIGDIPSYTEQASETFHLFMEAYPDVFKRMSVEHAGSSRLVRKGELFWAFVAIARRHYGINCDKDEWERAVEEYIEREQKRIAERVDERVAKDEKAQQAASRRAELAKKNSDAREARKGAKAAAEQAVANQAAADLQAAQAAGFATIAEHEAALAKAAEQAAKLAAAQQAGFATIAEHERYESDRRIEEKRKEKEALKAEKEALKAQKEAEKEAEREAKKKAQGKQLSAKAQQNVDRAERNMQAAAANANAAGPPPAPARNARAAEQEALVPVQRKGKDKGKGKKRP